MRRSLSILVRGGRRGILTSSGGASGSGEEEAEAIDKRTGPEIFSAASLCSSVCSVTPPPLESRDSNCLLAASISKMLSSSGKGSSDLTERADIEESDDRGLSDLGSAVEKASEKLAWWYNCKLAAIYRKKTFNIVSDLALGLMDWITNNENDIRGLTFVLDTPDGLCAMEKR